MEWPWHKLKRLEGLEEQVAQQQRVITELKAENERLKGERGRGVERERSFHLVSHLFNFGIRGAQPVCLVEKRERATPVAPGPLDIGEKKDVVKVAGVFVDELRRDLVGFAQTAGVVVSLRSPAQGLCIARVLLEQLIEMLQRVSEAPFSQIEPGE